MAFSMRRLIDTVTRIEKGSRTCRTEPNTDEDEIDTDWWGQDRTHFYVLRLFKAVAVSAALSHSHIKVRPPARSRSVRNWDLEIYQEKTACSFIFFEPASCLCRELQQKLATQVRRVASRRVASGTRSFRRERGGGCISGRQSHFPL